MKKRQILRTYLALVDGLLPDSGTINAPIARMEGSVITREVNFGTGESAITHYERLAAGKEYSLAELHLETGRTHQIRAQFSHIGNPLYGDTKYGSRHSGGMNLASYKLIFDFKTDAGILNYLNHKEFQISVDFAKTFAQQKL